MDAAPGASDADLSGLLAPPAAGSNRLDARLDWIARKPEAAWPQPVGGP
jgi:hypothetical protein